MSLQTITASAEGASAAEFVRQESLFRVRKESGAWAGESVAVEISHIQDANSFDPLYNDAGEAVVFTANGNGIIPGGVWVRLNVTGYTTAIKAYAKELAREY